MLTQGKFISINNSTTNNKLFVWNSYSNNDVASQLTIKQYEDFTNLLNKLLTQPKSTHLGKRVYLGRLSSLPRHKVKEYFKTNNISKTSKIDYADSIVLNKEHILTFLNNYANNSKYYNSYKLIDKYHIQTRSEFNIINKEINFYRDSDIPKLEKYFNDGKKLYIILDKFNAPYKTKNFLNQLCLKSEEIYFKDIYRDATLLEILEHLECLIKNPNINVVFDEDLLGEINKEGIILDQDYIKVLDDMFKSKNQDNINLALEMLSNINIEDNLLNLSLLLNRNEHLFSWGSGLSMTNNNSFKSILKYLKQNSINYKEDWRDFHYKLSKKYINDPESLLTIENSIKMNLNNYLNDMNSSFNIKEFKLAF